MTLPATEVCIFDTSDAFRANPEASIPVFAKAKENGIDIPTWYGPDAEDPRIGFIFANHTSYEAHKAIMDAPFYKDLMAGLAPALAGPFKLDHVTFSGPTCAFDFPITEVTVLNAKTPAHRAALVALLSDMAAVTHNRFVFGSTRNDDNRFVAICGWESVQAHREACLSPQARGIAAKMYSLADEEKVYHAKLKKD